MSLLKTIILGPPGAGKGTISSRIVNDFRMQHVSSGDHLRSHMSNSTEIGAEAKKFVSSGQLVPDDVMIKLIASELNRLDGDSWLLDGFPRTVTQADALHDHEPAHAIINLKVPFDIIIDRIKGRRVHPGSGRIYHTEFSPPKNPGFDDVTGEPLILRDDDREQTVRRRLELYQSQTQPVIDYYKKHGLLQEFAGNTSNEIWPKIHSYLATRIQPLKFTDYGQH